MRRWKKNLLNLIHFSSWVSRDCRCDHDDDDAIRDKMKIITTVRRRINLLSVKNNIHLSICGRGQYLHSL